MKLGAYLMISIGAALTALAQDPSDNATTNPESPAVAQDFQPIDAPEASDESTTNGSIVTLTAPDENVDVDSVKPMDAPDIEADGQPDQTPDITNVEVEAAPAVDAAPTPEAEAGDASSDSP